MKQTGPRIVPSETIHQHLTCNGCIYLKSHLVMSGRKPWWERHCLHHYAKKDTRSGSGSIVAMIPDDVTPEWCPVLVERRNGPEVET